VNRSLLAVLLLAAVPAAAQQQLPPAAPAADVKPAQAAPAAQPLKYSPEIVKAAKNLALLLDRGAEVPPEKLDALAPELTRFNGKLEAALGADLIADAARREAEREDAARAAAAEQALQDFRTALQVYYGVNNAKYPANPSQLGQDGRPAIPELHLPRHEASVKVTIIDSKKYDSDVSKAVADSGGWLYFSNPESMNYGLLIIDCSHKAPNGTEFFKY
jgi:hypothetical protein